MSVLNYPALGRSNLSPSFVILMSKVCFAHGGVTIIGNGFDLIAMTDALIGCKYLSLSLGVVFNLYGSAGFLCQKDLHGVVQIYFLSLEYFFSLDTLISISIFSLISLDLLEFNSGKIYKELWRFILLS